MGVRGYGGKPEPEPEPEPAPEPESEPAPESEPEPGIKIFSQTGSTGFTEWEKLLSGDR